MGRMAQPYDRTLKHLLDAYARDLLEQLFHPTLLAHRLMFTQVMPIRQINCRNSYFCVK